ncbi:hypothetical protein [Streptomyces hydrogenans]|uniref:Uncharacterized protein n=1 Tax=Streptomyces hydrogenans TaxID=1873719 RepID=A0ABQ3PJL4_9ACTN|nr:hypothetical protein [Streptomyces hydrogenans]GHG10119.1 hypothetical protein GCM10018784_23510 [Streptomyces hydrogenans]GHI25197.1 hypothetical protein Shyd_65680 [Streptomyces hydrogenans]
MKVTCRGYRALSGWRYRVVCPCGWSFDVPRDMWHTIGPAITKHTSESRRCA